MTGDRLPILNSVQPHGRFVVLTYTRLDGSPATLTVEGPVEHSMDAKVREPTRHLTIFPAGDLPREFLVEASQSLSVSDTLARVPDPCDMCGEDGALPLESRGGGLYCPACAARAQRFDVAERDLIEQVGPVLGAWAARWFAEGLSMQELIGALEAQGGMYLQEKYRNRYIRTHLYRLIRAPRATREAVHADD